MSYSGFAGRGSSTIGIQDTLKDIESKIDAAKKKLAQPSKDKNIVNIVSELKKQQLRLEKLPNRCFVEDPDCFLHKKIIENTNYPREKEACRQSLKDLIYKFDIVGADNGLDIELSQINRRFI